MYTCIFLTEDLGPCVPNLSAATLCATVTAATRLGCVTATTRVGCVGGTVLTEGVVRSFDVLLLLSMFTFTSVPNTFSLFFLFEFNSSCTWLELFTKSSSTTVVSTGRFLFSDFALLEFPLFWVGGAFSRANAQSAQNWGIWVVFPLWYGEIPQRRERKREIVKNVRKNVIIS